MPRSKKALTASTVLFVIALISLPPLIREIEFTGIVTTIVALGAAIMWGCVYYILSDSRTTP